MRLIVCRTAEIAPSRLGEIRTLLDDSFSGEFSDGDWNHTLGGVHVLPVDGPVVVHAAVVARSLDIGGLLRKAGYVEGVATAPDRRREGLGSMAMRMVNRMLRADFEVGVLSTSSHEFYEPLGWERWRGPTFVRDGGEVVRTADEDDGIMVLRFAATSELDISAAITCEKREGDDW